MSFTIMSNSYLKNQPNLVGFLSGFLMSLGFYVILRLIGIKLPFNLGLPIILSISLAGISIGAFVSGIGIEEDKIRKKYLLLFLVLVFFVVSNIYNQNIPSHYILPKPDFPLLQPKHPIIHTALLLFSPFLGMSYFFILGYFFSNCLKTAPLPLKFYAIHLLGFFFGGIVGFYTVGVLGGYIVLLVCVGIATLFFLPRKLSIYLGVLTVLSCLCFWSIKKPENFFLWQVKDYKNLGTFWSPYYKLDFISYSNDSCIGGVYNDFFLWYVCNDPSKDHLQRREIFNVAAKNKNNVLIIGGSGGVATQTIWNSNKKIKKSVAVEIDPVVVREMSGRFAKYNKGVFSLPNVEVIAAEGRTFIERDKRKYDLIFYDGLDNRLITFRGSLVTVENYLFTQEAYKIIFEKRLSEHGILTIDVGGFEKKSIFPIIASFPKNIHYKVFWYIISDYPMFQLPLFFVIAAKDKQALENICQQLKNIVSIEEVKIPNNIKEILNKNTITDDKPFLYSYIYPIIAIFSLLCMPVFTAIFVLSLKKIRNGEMTDMIFTKKSFIIYFLVIGINYAMLESFLISKNSRFFLGPAFGATILISLFIGGGIAANFICSRYIKLVRIPIIFMCTILLTFVIYFNISAGSQTSAVLCSFAAGFLASIFWIYGVVMLTPEIRSIGYAFDSLGVVIGIVIFQLLLLSLGYKSVGIVILFFYLILAVICLMTFPNRKIVLVL